MTGCEGLRVDMKVHFGEGLFVEVRLKVHFDLMWQTEKLWTGKCSVLKIVLHKTTDCE